MFNILVDLFPRRVTGCPLHMPALGAICFLQIFPRSNLVHELFAYLIAAIRESLELVATLLQPPSLFARLIALASNDTNELAVHLPRECSLHFPIYPRDWCMQ